MEAAAQLCENVLGRTKDYTHTHQHIYIFLFIYFNRVSKKNSDFFFELYCWLTAEPSAMQYGGENNLTYLRAVSLPVTLNHGCTYLQRR